MAVYKLFPVNDLNSAIARQKKLTLSYLQQKKTKQDIENLEQALNNFFYGPHDSKDKFYQRASELAEQEFDKRYQSHSFELDMDKATAKFTNQNINFINRDASLEEVQKTAIEIENYMQQTGRSKESWLTVIEKIKKMQSLSNWQDVKDLNGIIASIRFGNKTAYGDAFEYPLAAFGALINQGVEATEDDLLEEFYTKTLQGGFQSTPSLNISHVSKKDRSNLNIKGTVNMNDGVKLEYSNPTKDKVDVVLTFDDKDFNISAKSYSSIYKDIHLTGGVPFSVPILNLSSVDFVSHYLTELYQNGNLSQIHEAVRLNILLMSLTGIGNSSSEANTFVINDKSNRRIYVRSISDIINYIANSGQWKYFKINGGNEIPDTPLRNFKEKNTNNTIGDMISEMHKIKLSASLKGTVIKNAKI